MKIDMTHQMLYDMVIGTGGPGNYEGKYDMYGELTGFPNERWVWHTDVLKRMHEEQLLQLYHQLKAEK